MSSYLVYRAGQDLFGATVRAPGTILKLIVLYFQLMFILLVVVAQLAIWLIIAFDWIFKAVPAYKRWRKIHKFPSEKDPDNPHII